MNIQTLWYNRHFFAYILWPFSCAYRAAMALRRGLYRLGIKKITHFSTPVIVVGNITVGGVGKTPLVIALAEWLRQEGFRPGLVSRGYGGSATRFPHPVFPDSDPRLAGDEAVLLAQKTACPMVVCKDRVAAVAALLQDYDCNIVISDDGLQHFALGRDIEIAVIDGARRFGNGFCLPAGPLREPEKRLNSVDFIVINGSARPDELSMYLAPREIYQLLNPARRLDIAAIQPGWIHAVAAIGHPQRFFDTLEKLEFKIIPHSFPDHYFFKKSDLEFADNAPVIMTEKDGIKCRAFADERHWCLKVQAELPAMLLANLKIKLKNG